MGRRPPLSSTERSMKFPTFRRVRRKRKANVFLIMIGQAMDFHFIASISMPTIHGKTNAKVTKRNETGKKIINFLANPKNFHRKKDTKESLLFYLTRYFATKSLSIDLERFDNPNSWIKAYSGLFFPMINLQSRPSILAYKWKLPL